MKETDKTIVYRASMRGMYNSQWCITVFDGTNAPFSINFDAYESDDISFGRQEDNDVVLCSKLVSRSHGHFVRIEGKWFIEDCGSRNGLICNDIVTRKKELIDGDIIRIDNGNQKIREGVLFIVSSVDEDNHWKKQVISSDEITVGRSEECSIALPHPSVSRVHAVLRRKDDGWIISDSHSTNGVMVNDRTIAEPTALQEKDVITITNSKLIFTSDAIYYCCYRGGISVEVHDLVIQHGSGSKARILVDHVSLNAKPGEMIAIIGGSGAGKSTLLNAMCGYLTPSSGAVTVNGVDLHRNFKVVKQLVGYVPQSDIIYNDLTVEDMLKYAADLRLPNDTSAQERSEAINRAIETVGLNDKRSSVIRSLSGGQRKRASIAVELLSDPNLLFLDEPASGLDPDTERSLMRSLRQMAELGKTVILVTHSTLQLKMCDKLAVMGPGGMLCYYGHYDEALRFFGIDDIVDVYALVSESAPTWRDRYREAFPQEKHKAHTGKTTAGRQGRKAFHLGVLCSRSLKLITNDRQRLLMLLFQAPCLALLISLVADGNQFKTHTSSRALLFALACAAFWVGMLNAIQEICKERTILKREYMAGLSLTAYLTSKAIVMLLLSIVQSALMLIVFMLLVGGLPKQGVLIDARIEMYLTILLTMIAASSTGLLVSSITRNPDKALALAPILLMPQILFSGLAFALKGITNTISWLTACRWGMEGLGTSANLNALEDTFQFSINGIPFKQSLPYNDLMFAFTEEHLMKVWIVLAGYTLILLLVSRLALNRIKGERDR